MPWMQMIVPRANLGAVVDSLEPSFVAASAPQGWALLAREGEEGPILLLTPDWAAALGSAISPLWEVTPNPGAVGWSVLIGSKDALTRFGLAAAEHD